jgi:hypothetical protein
MSKMAERTEWSLSIGLRLAAIRDQLLNPLESVRRAKELSSEGDLLSEWGSRSLPWRFYLGLLDVDVPDSDDIGSFSSMQNMRLKMQWVKQTREMRSKFADLQQSLSIKAMMQA